MKVALLEDLIADLYSRLYEMNAPQLMEVANEENKEKMKVDHLLMANDGAADAAITPPTSAPPSEAPAPRGRTKGIARRDIQKRAETIVTRKLTVRALTTKTTAPTDGEPSQPSTTGVTSAPHPAKENLLRGEGVEDPASGQQSDIPNSLHDSADDESELSEIDDEKLSKLAAERKALMFPNLNGSPGSGMSAAASADGEGGDEDREGEIDVGEGEGETMMEDEGEEGEGEEGDMEGEEGDEIDDEGEHEGHGEEGDEEGEGEVEMEDFKEGEETEQPEANGAAQESENAGDPDPMET